MIAIYDEKVDALSQVQFRIIKLADTIAVTATKLPWIIALVPLFLLGLIYTSLLFVPVLLARKSVTRLTNALLQDMSFINQREAMLLHAEIEEIRMKLQKFLIRTRSFFIFYPIVNELTLTVREYHRAESALSNIAYPNSNKPLTENQYETYLKAFRNWKDEDSLEHLELC